MNSEIVLRQLKDDLTGKDAYRGITLTYAWLANQFGHFALGFIPAMLLCESLRGEIISNAPIFSAFMISVFWILFEMVNFLGPLLLQTKPKKVFPFFKPKNKYTFAPRWVNLGLDTFTDICFFCIGAFTYSLLVKYSNFNLILIIGFLAIIIKPCNYWFKTRLYQLNARYPFQFRLSQWNFKMESSEKEKVIDFIKSKEKKHLLIFGSFRSGKTSLSVGICNELSIKHKTCFYTNAMKLYGEFYSQTKSPSKNLWHWKEADYMIIDDINPGCPIDEEIVTANQFLKYIDRGKEIDVENRSQLKNKSVIWVLGNGAESIKGSWKKMLIEIGVDKQNISVIELSESFC